MRGKVRAADWREKHFLEPDDARIISVVTRTVLR